VRPELFKHQEAGHQLVLYGLVEFGKLGREIWIELNDPWHFGIMQ
jgi:hypothetical protein